MIYLASAPITDDGIGAFIVLALIFLVSFVGWLRNRRAYGDLEESVKEDYTWLAGKGWR